MYVPEENLAGLVVNSQTSGLPNAQSEIAQQALIQKQAAQFPDINGGLIPFDEGCRLVNRSAYTLRLWLRQEKLTRYKRGRSTFLDPAELETLPRTS